VFCKPANLGLLILVCGSLAVRAAKAWPWRQVVTDFLFDVLLEVLTDGWWFWVIAAVTTAVLSVFWIFSRLA
jgi:hypothetical protein